MKSLCAGLISLALTLAFVSQAQSGGATGPIWPFQDNIPDTLMNTFGEYQNIQGSKRIHSAIDIHRDSLKVMVVADAESCWWRRKFNLSSDSAYYSIITGEQEHGNCYGWGYTHVDIGYTFDSLKLKLGDKLQQRANLSRIFRTFDHLHFSRIYGFSNTMPPWPPGEPDTFKIIKAVRNPLDDLPAEQDTCKPWFYGRVNGNWPIFLQRDSSEQSLGDTFKIKSNINGDTTKRYVVNKKVDVVPWVKDRTRSDLYSVGIDRIYYSIRGVNGVTQGSKGFSFRLNMPSSFQLEDTSLSKEVQQRVYADTGQSLVGMPQRYIVSNTDSLTSTFDVLGYLVGYWNSKQHKDRAWDEDESATQDSARFKDGYYWVKVQAWDSKNNTDSDSLKVIVNNFPPQIASTYPESASANVPLNAVIKVVFDQPMDTLATKRAMKVKLVGATDTVAGTKSWGGSEDTLRFNPTSNWATDTTYRVTIIAATGPDTTRDIADSTLVQDYSFPFSTRKTVLLVSYHHIPGDTTFLEKYDTTGTRLLEYGPQRTTSQAVKFGDLVYDRTGNNYVVYGTASGGGRKVKKFDYSGNPLDTLLAGEWLRGIATDDTSLFFLWSRDGGATYRKVLKTDKSGAPQDSFIIPHYTAYSLAYCPWDNLLYIVYGDTVGSNMAHYLQKFGKNGSSGSSVFLKTVWQGQAGVGLAVNDMRVFWLWMSPFYTRNYIYTNDRVTLAVKDTIKNLWNYAPRGAAQYTNWWGLAVDRNHFYVTVWSDDPGTELSYDWVGRMDKWGGIPQGFEFSAPPDTEHGAIAVYPSILGTPGMSIPGGGGGSSDGGAQTAGLTNLLPKTYALGQSYPNPAKGGLMINYALPQESQVSLKVFNVAGQLIRSLREEREKPGFYRAEWDMKDQQGRRVGSGVYLYRIEAGDFAKTGKLIVVR